MEMELDHIIGMLRIVNLCDYRYYNCDCLDYEEIASNRYGINYFCYIVRRLTPSVIPGINIEKSCSHDSQESKRS